MKNQMNKFRIKMTLVLTTAMLAVLLFGGTALAQNPKPTPIPPSGSNPQSLAPTDIPPDSSLLGVLIFFLFLCVWLCVSNFLVRTRIFSDQIDQPSSATQPEAPQLKGVGSNGTR